MTSNPHKKSLPKVLTAGEKPEVPTWSGIGDFDVVKETEVEIIINIFKKYLNCSLNNVQCYSSQNILYQPHPLAGVGLASQALVHGCLPSQVIIKVAQT